MSSDSEKFNDFADGHIGPFPIIFIRAVNGPVRVGEAFISCDSCMCTHRVGGCIHHSMRIPISPTEFIKVYVTTRERNFIWEEDGYRPGVLMKKILDDANGV